MPVCQEFVTGAVGDSRPIAYGPGAAIRRRQVRAARQFRSGRRSASETQAEVPLSADGPLHPRGEFGEELVAGRDGGCP